MLGLDFVLRWLGLRSERVADSAEASKLNADSTTDSAYPVKVAASILYWSGVPITDPFARDPSIDGPRPASLSHERFRVPDYIGDGVIAKALGWSEGRIKDDITRLEKLGSVVAESLDFGDDLSEVQQQRIYQYYLPTYFWALDQLQQHKQSGAKGPLVVRSFMRMFAKMQARYAIVAHTRCARTPQLRENKGTRASDKIAQLANAFSCVQLGISAPQGCGKTTIVMELEKLFAVEKLRCASISIDDFYLSHADQQQLSADQPDNRLVQGRGNAGTHDLQLGSETLAALCSLGCAFDTALALPRALGAHACVTLRAPRPCRT